MDMREKVCMATLSCRGVSRFHRVVYPMARSGPIQPSPAFKWVAGSLEAPIFRMDPNLETRWGHKHLVEAQIFWNFAGGTTLEAHNLLAADLVALVSRSNLGVLPGGLWSSVYQTD